MGAPGSGKSTICDYFWGPHELRLSDQLPPYEWGEFVDELTRLFGLIKKHPTLPAAVRMNNRSLRKMATVHRAPLAYGPYIQTGLAQRGLGFGWRMKDMGIDMDELRPFFRLMPVSIGVAVTRCPTDIVEQRNHARKLVKETAHEDRAHMVALMLPAIDVALEELNARGVPILEVSTEQDIDASREEIRAFSMQSSFEPETLGRRSQAPILSAPYWWVGPGERGPLPQPHPREEWRPYGTGHSN